ncbi:MAG: GspE/PulE family protein [Patescibacteria group bacterium]|nr:GspE/PulE family protein [Patescibacteria group bacterium]
MGRQEDFLKLLKESKNLSESSLLEIKGKADAAGKKIEDVLVAEKLIDSEEMAQIKAKVYGLPYQNLLDREVSNEVINIISFEAAENYKIICFDKSGNKIKVGLTDPENFKAMEAVNFLAKEEKFRVEYYLISGPSFDKVFKQYRNLKSEIGKALETHAKEEEGARKKAKESGVDLEEVIKSAPVAKIVSVIIRHAVEGRASDIHIEPTQTESRVRYRIDGVLHTSLVLPRDIHNAIVARVKVMANLKLDETRLPQDGRINIEMGEKKIDFRVSVMPLIDEEKVVMRILDTTTGAPTLEELGFDGRALRIIKENIKKTTGMLLVTGPTGSGKSTTLFAILNMLNKEGVNIYTLEDPVEYFIKGINQSQTRPEIGFSFANGLRSLLRQDPDIIMVGEIRDNETAELAIHASLTGHFVLSTLHTNDAVGAVARMLDMKVEPFLLGSTLNVIIAQRLARKICPHCKKEEKLPEDILADMENEMKKMPQNAIKELVKDFVSLDKTVFFKGVGCPRCGNSGYSGRIAIVEALDINDRTRDIIMDKNKILRFDSTKESQDFVSMKQDGIMKVLRGETTMEEVLRVIQD